MTCAQVKVDPVEGKYHEAAFAFDPPCMIAERPTYLPQRSAQTGTGSTGFDARPKSADEFIAAHAVGASQRKQIDGKFRVTGCEPDRLTAKSYRTRANDRDDQQRLGWTRTGLMEGTLIANTGLPHLALCLNCHFPPPFAVAGIFRPS